MAHYLTQPRFKASDLGTVKEAGSETDTTATLDEAAERKPCYNLAMETLTEVAKGSDARDGGLRRHGGRADVASCQKGRDRESSR